MMNCQAVDLHTHQTVCLLQNEFNQLASAGEHIRAPAGQMWLIMSQCMHLAQLQQNVNCEMITIFEYLSIKSLLRHDSEHTVSHS